MASPLEKKVWEINKEGFEINDGETFLVPINRIQNVSDLVNKRVDELMNHESLGKGDAIRKAVEEVVQDYSHQEALVYKDIPSYMRGPDTEIFEIEDAYTDPKNGEEKEKLKDLIPRMLPNDNCFFEGNSGVFIKEFGKIKYVPFPNDGEIKEISGFFKSTAIQQEEFIDMLEDVYGYQGMEAVRSEIPDLEDAIDFLEKRLEEKKKELEKEIEERKEKTKKIRKGLSPYRNAAAKVAKPVKKVAGVVAIPFKAAKVPKIARGVAIPLKDLAGGVAKPFKAAKKKVGKSFKPDKYSVDSYLRDSNTNAVSLDDVLTVPGSGNRLGGYPYDLAIQFFKSPGTYLKGKRGVLICKDHHTALYVPYPKRGKVSKLPFFRKVKGFLKEIDKDYKPFHVSPKYHDAQKQLVRNAEARPSSLAKDKTGFTPDELLDTGRKYKRKA